VPQNTDEIDLDALYVAALRGNQRLQGKPYYEPAADSVFYFFRDEAANAVRVDGLVTLYRSIETGALVGIQIKRIKRLVKELARFGNLPTEVTVRFILQHVAASQESPPGVLNELINMPEAEQQLPEEALV
jgi:hypothetical protein